MASVGHTVQPLVLRLLLLLLVAFFLVTGSTTALEVHRPAFLARRKFSTDRLSFSPPKFCSRDYRGEVIVVTGAQLCSESGGEGRWEGAIVLALSSECSAVAQAVAAQKKGAVGLLLKNPVNSSGTGGGVNIPVEVLSDKDHDAVVMTIREGIAVEASLGTSLNSLRFAV